MHHERPRLGTCASPFFVAAGAGDGLLRRFRLMQTARLPHRPLRRLLAHELPEAFHFRLQLGQLLQQSLNQRRPFLRWNLNLANHLLFPCHGANRNIKTALRVKIN